MNFPRDILDLSDHNLITVTLNIFYDSVRSFSNKFKTFTFNRNDPVNCAKFKEKVEAALLNTAPNCIEDLNVILTDSENSTLKCTIRKRMETEEESNEPKWITKEIKKGISKKRSLRKQHRNQSDVAIKTEIQKELYRN